MSDIEYRNVSPCRRELHLRSAMVVAGSDARLRASVRNEYRRHTAACPVCCAWIEQLRRNVMAWEYPEEIWDALPVPAGTQEAR